MQVIIIDPERITSRIFGGPYFVKMERISETTVKHPKSGKVYDLAEINVAWSESRNARPVGAGQ